MLSPELALVLKDRPSAESSALRGSREWCGNNGRRCLRMLTGQEDHSSFPTLQVLVIDKAPVLHTKQRSIDLYESM